MITSFGETPFLSKTPPRGYLVKGLKGTPVPLINYLPLPLLREGGRGDRLLSDLSQVKRLVFFTGVGYVILMKSFMWLFNERSRRSKGKNRETKGSN